MSTSHHGDAKMLEILKRFTQQVDGTARREYPMGRMGHEDDGALSYVVAADEASGTVVIRFGKPVEWIGLHPKDVGALVQSLIAKARIVAKEPFTVEI